MFTFWTGARQVSIIGRQQADGVEYAGGRLQIRILDFDEYDSEKFVRFTLAPEREITSGVRNTSSRAIASKYQ